MGEVRFELQLQLEIERFMALCTCGGNPKHVISYLSFIGGLSMAQKLWESSTERAEWIAKLEQKASE